MLRQREIDYLKQGRNGRNRRSQLILIIIGSLVGLVALAYLFFWISLAPARSARSEAENVAASVGITKTERFLVANDSNAYYGIIGRTNSGEQKVAIIKRNSQQATVLMRRDGLSDDKLNKLIIDNYHPAKIYSIGLSIYKEQPVWSISFLSKNNKLNYVKLDYQSGEEYQIIKGI